MLKRIICSLLAALLVISVMTSCTGTEKKQNDTQQSTQDDNAGGDYSNVKADTYAPFGETVMTIGGQEIGIDEFKYYYSMLKYYSDAADENSFQTLIDEVVNELKLNRSLEILAAANKVSLTDEEYKTQIKDYVQQVKDSYGDSYEQELKNSNLTEGLFENQLRLSSVFQKLFDETTKDGAIFDYNDLEKIKASALEQNVIRAKHVLIQFGSPEYVQVPENEEGMTDEQKEAAKSANEAARKAAEEADKADKLAIANEVLKKAKAGEDFDSLIAEYNDDPGMQSYPGGYYFKDGDMVEEFYTASVALEEGGISDIVETSYGYHIIQRLPYDDESLMASSFAQNESSNAEYNSFMNEIYAISDGLEVTYIDDFETKYTFEELEKLTGSVAE